MLFLHSESPVLLSGLFCFILLWQHLLGAARGLTLMSSNGKMLSSPNKNQRSCSHLVLHQSCREMTRVPLIVIDLLLSFKKGLLTPQNQIPLFILWPVLLFISPDCFGVIFPVLEKSGSTGHCFLLKIMGVSGSRPMLL